VPRIINFTAKKSQYQQGDRALLAFKLQNFSQMTQLLANGKSDSGIAISPLSFNFNGKIPQDLRQYCSQTLNDELSCNNLPVTLPNIPGAYTLQLLPKSNTYQQPQLSEAIKFQILATPPKIISFTLNDKTQQQSSTLFLEEKEIITLKWQIEGDDLNVKLSPIGNVPASGSITLKATTNLSEIVLTATNKHGQSISQAFLVQVQSIPPIPTPNPSPNFSPVLPPPPSIRQNLKTFKK
jgi:hypothetical protein